MCKDDGCCKKRVEHEEEEEESEDLFGFGDGFGI